LYALPVVLIFRENGIKITDFSTFNPLFVSFFFTVGRERNMTQKGGRSENNSEIQRKRARIYRVWRLQATISFCRVTKKEKKKKKETGGTNTSGTVRREIRGKTAGVLENGCEEQAEDERQKERR
jgi:hypothetical protein